ncbi:hypothetical protein ACHAWF_011062 [Thalassiosira exigua]
MGHPTPTSSSESTSSQRNIGRPKGRSTKWNNLPVRASRSRSTSPIPPALPRQELTPAPSLASLSASDNGPQNDRLTPLRVSLSPTEKDTTASIAAITAASASIAASSSGESNAGSTAVSASHGSTSFRSESASAATALLNLAKANTPAGILDVSPKPKRRRTQDVFVVSCHGIASGSFGSMLNFAGLTLLNTGRKLMQWAKEGDAGLKSFSDSLLAKTNEMVLPLNGMIMRRAKDATNGFAFYSPKCLLQKLSSKRSEAQRCAECSKQKIYAKKKIAESHQPIAERAHSKTNIGHIANNPDLAEIEIIALRKEVRRLSQKAARAVFKEEMQMQSVKVSAKEGQRIRKAVNIMSNTIETELSNGGDDEACELWILHRESINKHFDNGGKSRKKKVPVHPVLLNWAIAFLAKTSSSVYKEVAKVMLLPDISYVYRKSKELVSRSSNKGYSLHLETIRTISQRATKEGWTGHQRRGTIAQDSANVKSTVEHDLVSNQFVGGDESHKIGTLSKLFQQMAQKVKDTTSDCENSNEKNKNSILDELRLAGEHLVFKWTSIDPDVKCSIIFASINVEKVTPEILTTVLELLMDTLPLYGLGIAFETSDAAGCNWKATENLVTLPISIMLPTSLTRKYPAIDFNINIVFQDPVTDEFVIFLPDMPHLTKNIVTALEYSGSKHQKRSIMYGLCPVHLGMVEEVWMSMDGLTCQLQDSKLTVGHFDKNAYSRMNVSLAMQILSASVARMIREAIADDEIKLILRNKGMYNHIAHLCENWNLVVDICNGRDGPHSPLNAEERQTQLLNVLNWFSQWKAKHDVDAANESKSTNEYNFFADETWFCIRALILAHAGAIQLYCIERDEKLDPRSMNTDVVEWFFGNGRQSVGGSTNKLTARGWGHAGFKEQAFQVGRHNVVGNNKTGADVFARKKRF